MKQGLPFHQARRLLDRVIPRLKIRIEDMGELPCLGILKFAHCNGRNAW